jgi:6-phosphofructokinase 2
MARILTLTMNPAIDVSTSVDRVTPTRKLRCAAARRDPGGGGINVARVARRLGARAVAVYPTGGVIGQLLRQLVDAEDVDSVAVPVREETREDFTALETSTGKQFRFVLEGPHLSGAEWMACLETVAGHADRPDLIVVSGSLPPGVPEDFYARIAEIARAWEIKLALDCAGPALKAALEHGVYLAKPNLGELRGLVGAPLPDEASRIAACRSLISAGQAEAVALTLGADGALLVTADAAWRAPPMAIEAVSAVGAGDSFLGGMAWALAEGRPLEEAFKYAMAAGSAAVLSPGTELCHAEDVWRLADQVVIEPLEVAPARKAVSSAP